MRNCLLSLCLGFFRGAKLSLETLGEHVLFETDDVHEFFLEVAQTVAQVLVLIPHLAVDLLLLLRDHQVEVVVARYLAEFEFPVASHPTGRKVCLPR